MPDAPTGPTPAQLANLRRSFGGEVIAPHHEAYGDARRVWNAVFDRRPALVVRPSHVADIATAIRFGRDRDLEIAVRGGGHSASGPPTPGPAEAAAAGEPPSSGGYGGVGWFAGVLVAPSPPPPPRGGGAGPGPPPRSRSVRRRAGRGPPAAR